MGLDMYLEGEKFIWTDWMNPENNPKEDGYEIKATILRLGYWRKHPDLHGYITQNFADGIDECQRIELSAEDLQTILDAVKKSILPHTEGFFFGSSRPGHMEPTIKILEGAIKWLTEKDKKYAKSVYYQASW